MLNKSVHLSSLVVLFATQNKDLLELSENEKEFTPLTVTQAIVYI